MTQGEVVKLFKAITLSYPAFRVPDDMAKEQVMHWYQHLKDVPFDVAMENLREYVQAERFPPTIADIRRGYSAEKSTVPGVDETREWLAELDKMRKRAVPMPDYVREELRRIVRQS
ncbi:replicative helicase inhibitor G39P [Paenibacillus sp. 32O-W]|uniref:replicative helicase loader/inhibitor n=1 Tax=Paenibacillus sp. 32O-W TaxID=1695218 RepID=UPI00071EEA9F|nr:replicative helicase loader/inhibitor [Paenibacillus sp. 32O-W]ALS27167.1 replicative helicase inhibitor G39P [Paenibacillus sp. 32O-W]